MSKFIVYCDGGARGNPGPAGYGFVIKAVINSKSETLNPKQIPNSKFKIIKGSGYIGAATNNQAEYQAVLAALKLLKSQIPNTKSQTNSKSQIPNPEIKIFLDSKLIVEQMNGRYKIKNEGLKPLYWQIRDLMMELGGAVTFSYIPRQQNEEADRLVNMAIDRGE